MTKRLLDCWGSDFAAMGRRELLESIGKSEGRTIACETIGSVPPMLADVTNAELAAGMGADLLILNLFDVENPVVGGLPETQPCETVRTLKRLTGRPVGINLEPVKKTLQPENDLWRLTEGRKATLENAWKAVEMGVDFIVLTGNPGVGVENRAIVETLSLFRRELGNRVILIAGKMHASGILSEAGEKIITPCDIENFVAAGADIILLPAPATVPGIGTEYVRKLVERSHELGALTMTAIGTSQEGADIGTIRSIALMCKATGADIHHLGDAGYCGIALPENIAAYSVAVRGVRHTYRRMAGSINR